jgi:Sec-independent protein translocase protein TatA
VLALVFVGPQRLPEVAYQVGRAVRTMQKYARAVRDEFRDEIGYVEEQYKVMKGEVDTLRTEMRQQDAELQRELREATAPINAALADASAATNVVPIDAYRGDGRGAASSTPAQDAPAQAPGEPPLVF